jgi:hypothetical protein
VLDLLDVEDAKTTEEFKKMLSPRNSQMVVTPTEIDLLIDRASRLISLGINCALHQEIDIGILEGLM